MCEQLAQGRYWQCPGPESIRGPFSYQFGPLPLTIPVFQIQGGPIYLITVQSTSQQTDRRTNRQTTYDGTAAYAMAWRC